MTDKQTPNAVKVVAMVAAAAVVVLAVVVLFANQPNEAPPAPVREPVDTPDEITTAPYVAGEKKSADADVASAQVAPNAATIDDPSALPSIPLREDSDDTNLTTGQLGEVASA